MFTVYRILVGSGPETGKLRLRGLSGGVNGSTRPFEKMGKNWVTGAMYARG